MLTTNETSNTHKKCLTPLSVSWFSPVRLLILYAKIRQLWMTSCQISLEAKVHLVLAFVFLKQEIWLEQVVKLHSGTQWRFPSKYLEHTFYAIHSSFRSLEIHPTRHRFCSFMLGDFECFRNYKGFGIIFPKILDAFYPFINVNHTSSSNRKFLAIFASLNTYLEKTVVGCPCFLYMLITLHIYTGLNHCASRIC